MGGRDHSNASLQKAGETVTVSLYWEMPLAASGNFPAVPAASLTRLLGLKIHPSCLLRKLLRTDSGVRSGDKGRKLMVSTSVVQSERSADISHYRQEHTSRHCRSRGPLQKQISSKAFTKQVSYALRRFLSPSCLWKALKNLPGCKPDLQEFQASIGTRRQSKHQPSQLSESAVQIFAGVGRELSTCHLWLTLAGGNEHLLHLRRLWHRAPEPQNSSTKALYPNLQPWSGAPMPTTMGSPEAVGAHHQSSWPRLCNDRACQTHDRQWNPGASHPHHLQVDPVQVCVLDLARTSGIHSQLGIRIRSLTLRFTGRPPRSALATGMTRRA